MQNLDSRVEHSLIPVVARWAEPDKGMLLPLFQLIASGETLEEAKLAKDLGRGTDAMCAALEFFNKRHGSPGRALAESLQSST